MWRRQISFAAWPHGLRSRVRVTSSTSSSLQGLGYEGVRGDVNGMMVKSAIREHCAILEP
jgi:hypothetical protein